MEEYSALGKEIFLAKPEECPYCRKPGESCLIGHGFYSRYAFSLTGFVRIFIRVLKCKRTRRYVSLHPSFLLPYHQYLFSMVLEALRSRILDGRTMTESLRLAAGATGNGDPGADRPVYQHLQGWLGSLRTRGGVWVGLLGSFLQSFGELFVSPRPDEHAGNSSAAVLALFDRCVAASGLTSEAFHAQLFNRYGSSPFAALRSVPRTPP